MDSPTSSEGSSIEGVVKQVHFEESSESDEYASDEDMDHVPDEMQVSKKIAFTPLKTSSQVSGGSKTPACGSTQVYDFAAEPIKVFLKLRPLDISNKTMRKIDENSVAVQAPKESYAYKNGESEGKYFFSKVFDEACPQEDVFKTTAMPLISNVLDGRDGLLFAYGCTSSGKTYTIQGQDSDMGILPRSFDVIFDGLKGQLENQTEEDKVEHGTMTGYEVWVSYLEVYNENVYDLLDHQPSDPKKRKALSINVDQNGVTLVKDLKEFQVTCAEDAMILFQRGVKNRHVAETILNSDSSRSHCVFGIRIYRHYQEINENVECKDIRIAKLSIVDLAGAERSSKTNNRGDRMKETANINTSLMNLGRCLETLRWNQLHPKAPQRVVPYRQSKLTRLFQNVLQGHGLIVMIVNANPSPGGFDETNHALKYSAITREIFTVGAKVDTGLKRGVNAKNTPGSSMVNAADKQLMDSLVEEVEDLRQRLFDAEAKCARIECEVRDEVAAEMAERFAEMEEMYRSQAEEDNINNEDQYEKKLNIRTKVLSTAKKNQEDAASRREIADLEERLEDAKAYHKQERKKLQSRIQELESGVAQQPSTEVNEEELRKQLLIEELEDNLEEERRVAKQLEEKLVQIKTSSRLTEQDYEKLKESSIEAQKEISQAEEKMEALLQRATAAEETSQANKETIAELQAKLENALRQVQEEREAKERLEEKAAHLSQQIASKHTPKTTPKLRIHTPNNPVTPKLATPKVPLESEMDPENVNPNLDVYSPVTPAPTKETRKRKSDDMKQKNENKARVTRRKSAEAEEEKQSNENESPEQEPDVVEKVHEKVSNASRKKRLYTPKAEFDACEGVEPLAKSPKNKKVTKLVLPTVTPIARRLRTRAGAR